jgi:serine/threonine protein kinase
MWEIDRSEIEWGEERKLGTGTYGVVVYAKWRGTPVAVKKVNLAADSGGSGGAAGGGGGGGGGEGGGAVTGTTAIEDLRHEIAVMSHMHHPRVVQFLGASTRAKPWLILFEYLPGGTLTSIVDRPEHASGVRPALATRWSLECAQGLRYLHEHKPRPVIHRDLKPSNLLVDASGTAKISDFGERAQRRRLCCCQPLDLQAHLATRLTTPSPPPSFPTPTTCQAWQRCWTL